MAEYIERWKLMDHIELNAREHEESYDAWQILGDVEDFPAADVVEVVRCKDCKHLYCLSAVDRRFYCRHWPKGLEGINIVEENPYCSYGERRTDNEL